MKPIYVVILQKNNRTHIYGVFETLVEAKREKQNLICFLNKDTKILIKEKGVKK